MPEFTEVDTEELSTNVTNLGVELEMVNSYSKTVGPDLNEYILKLDLRIKELRKQIDSLQQLAWDATRTRDRLVVAQRAFRNVSTEPKESDHA